MALHYLTVFFISMLPLVELRLAVPVAVTLGIPPIRAILVCAVGNLIPVPFIYLFARKFLHWGKDKPYIGRICRFFLEKGHNAGEKLKRRAGRTGLFLALMLFVGIPVPGTGAWTGTLAASFLDMGPKSTAAAVTLGVVVAGVIMALASTGAIHVIGL